MPTPKSGTREYRPDLGAAIREFREGPQLGFIGLEVMPIFRTAKNSSSYPVIPKEALLKIQDLDRAPRGAYPRGDWEYERGFYTTTEKGWEEPIDDVEAELFGQEAPRQAEMVAAERAWNHIMRAQEKRIADLVFTNSGTNFATHDVANEWDKYSSASADPVSDVKDAVVAFKNQCGMPPDTLIINFETFHDIPRCAKVQDLLKYTYPGIDLQNMTAPILAALFGVPRVLVAGSVYDSAGKGQDATIADLWDHEYAMLCKTASGMDITEPCIGRTFLWTEDSPSNPIVETYREEQTRSDIIRVRHYVGEELIASKNEAGTVVSNISAACAYLLTNIHT